MTHGQLVRAATGLVVIPTVAVADGYWSRLAGLQFRAPLPPGHGLLLVGCSSVHTCFLRFALDLVMLDREWRVVETRRGVRPWRVVWPARTTHTILEMTAGEAPALEPGTELVLRLK